MDGTCHDCGKPAEVRSFPGGIYRCWKCWDKIQGFKHIGDDFKSHDLSVANENTERVGVTTDPTDPRLGHGVDSKPIKQHKVYLVLSPDERARGFVRPVRKTYVHNKCGVATTMSEPIAETYARDSKFYGSTYCCGCEMHLPVSEFHWDDGTIVGS